MAQSIQQTLQEAIARFQSGQWNEAHTLCRQLLASAPNHPDALHLLGLVTFQLGQKESAIDALRQAVAADPSRWDFCDTLGVALLALNRHEEAIVALRQAVAVKPDSAPVLFNLANALHAHRQHIDAIAAYRQAINLDPNFAAAYVNLGNALVAIGQGHEAVSAFRRGVGLQGDSADAWYNLGNALRAIGQRQEAIDAFHRALALQPDMAAAHINLANTLREEGKLDDAIAAYRQALALQPQQALTHFHLGLTLRAKGDHEAAAAALGAASALRPGDADMLHHLANALRAAGKFDQAIDAYQKTIDLRKDLADAHLNLGGALKDIGQIHQAIACYDRFLALCPNSPAADSHRLYVLHLDPDYQPEKVFQQHLQWDRQYAQPLAKTIEPHPNDRSPQRRLRIGYVSPDFHLHPVAFFLENLLAHHDRDAVEVFCYADLGRADAVTARLQRSAHHWRNVLNLGDAQLARLIREDRIDILVDLAGHTPGNRLLLFARKPAPIAVTYLGYPDTTGLTSIDYRLTDAYADPPGMTEALHTEQLVRLPETFLCPGPMDGAPEVNPLPAATADHVTFGSFNALSKVNDRIADLWARVVRQTPKSRMVIKSHSGLDNPSPRKRLLDIFAARGIGPERIELLDRTASLSSHLEAYHRIDLALDTFPYHGTTITCEALWMGVPTIALAGRWHASRVAVSLLSNAGLADCVADTPEQFVRMAVSLAQRPVDLARIRASLRQNMAQSPLTDARRLARNVEAAYRTMWRRWCQSSPMEDRDSRTSAP